MSTNYRNHLGNHITFDEWKDEQKNSDNCAKESDPIIKGEYEVTVLKRFCGTSGSLFKVSVDCSEDLENFYGYHQGFQGETKAEEDYQRVITAIENDTPLMSDGIIVLLED